MKYAVRFVTGKGGGGWLRSFWYVTQDVTQAQYFEDINKAHSVCHRCNKAFTSYIHYVEEIR